MDLVTLHSGWLETLWRGRYHVNRATFFQCVLDWWDSGSHCPTIHMQGTGGQSKINTYECTDIIRALTVWESKRYILSPFLLSATIEWRRRKHSLLLKWMFSMQTLLQTTVQLNWAKGNSPKLNYLLCSLASFLYFYNVGIKGMDIEIWAWEQPV